MDWVLSQTRLPIFFYDPLQSIGPSCLARDSFESRLGEAAKRPIRLESQMRVKAGDAYLRYIQDVLDGKAASKQLFEGYDFKLHGNFQDFVSCFERDYHEHNLSRMLAGYAWKWKSKKNHEANDISMDGVCLKWNCTYKNWVGKGVDDPSVAHEVGCIHSIQGYDLSYAYVIIGDDLVLGSNGIPTSNRSSYFDRNGHATATKEELDRYIKNIYYVLLTRGIMGTHVFVKNPRLREYFARFIPSE